MPFPWFISLYSHEKTVGLLEKQLEGLNEERKVLYDRLGLLGLGGPLFHLPSPEEIKATEEEEEDAEKEAAQELARLKAMRPSQRAAFITRKNQRDYKSTPRRPADAVLAAIDEAEALGKQLA